MIYIDVAMEHAPIPEGYDYVLYVTAEPPKGAEAQASTLAYALACQHAATGLPGDGPTDGHHWPASDTNRTPRRPRSLTTADDVRA